MLAATVSHREFAAQRLPGVPRVRVSESTSDVGHTVIEIVTDDAPFLVDSVTAALAARDLGVHVLVHPVMVVRRGVLGGLEEIRLGVEPEVAGFGDVSRAGFARRSTGSATTACSARSARRWPGSSPTCAWPSRTGRRCAARHLAWPRN